MRDHARHITGFQFRDYLQSLLVDPDVSFQFYQGMIQAKGTPASLGELIKTSQFENQEKLDFFEEWAVRVGNFGATDIRPSIELQIDRSEIRNNPQLIEFSSTYVADNLFDRSIQLNSSDSRWLRKPVDINNIWPLRGSYKDTLSDLPSAGYVRFDEVNYYITTFDALEDFVLNSNFIDLPSEWQPGIAYVAGDKVFYQSSIYEAFDDHTSSSDFNIDRELYWFYNSNISSSDLKERDTIWVYDSQNITKLGQFAVYRLTEVNATINLLSTGSTVITLDIGPEPKFNEDQYGLPYSSENITILNSRFKGDFINAGDVVFIPENTQSDPDLRGIHRITEIIDYNQFTIEVSINTDFDYTLSEFIPPKLFLLQNMRVEDRATMQSLINNLNASNTPIKDGELFWVDDDRSDTEINEGIEKYWAVYSYQSGATTRIRKQELRVDSECIINGIVYDKRKNRINTWLEVFDPRKGIIPGVADQEIWYKLDYDPAKYTNGDDSIHQIDPELAWGSNELGRLWWDLSTVKYPEYEISDHEYRDRWWGKIAPGTSIDVYEWVRSITEPSTSDTNVKIVKIQHG
ncbi:MAG: hypothetical protein HC836_10795 [Richelia sp. RM2_1_2]|nr:hypothetical protein [Richelia sp. RM2_1_2]